MTDAMIERAAAALVFEQSNGCCRIDKQCGLCDCGDPTLTWAYARDHAKAALDAAMPVVDTVEALDALPVGSVVAEMGDGRHGPTMLIREYDAPTSAEWSYAMHVGRPSTGGSPATASDVIVWYAPLRVIWTPEVTP